MGCGANNHACKCSGCVGRDHGVRLPRRSAFPGSPSRNLAPPPRYQRSVPAHLRMMLVPTPSPWHNKCGNCHLNAAVSAGSLTLAERDATLLALAADAGRLLWSPKGITRSLSGDTAVQNSIGVPHALAPGNAMGEWRTLDRSGADGCSDVHVPLIGRAISFIRGNLRDISTSCHANRNIFGVHTSCFAGHGYKGSVNPRDLVDKTLNDPDINFAIHCSSNVACGPLAAFTNGGQWAQESKDIHICRTLLDDVDAGTFSIRTLACVIVHEIFHVWGADEHAADSMEPSGWDCFR
jgi:hypothetical protein